MKRAKRAIVLRLDEAIVDRIDSVRHPLRMDRTTWLRKAVARNLAYNVEHELPIVAGREVQAVLMPWEGMMRKTKNSTIDTKDRKFQQICEELGEDAVRRLHEAYRLTAAALYRRAKQHADAKLRKEGSN
ncbi:MAG TPA: hypothetical protein VLY04_00875 [Bryobacteraceae bacterium]|nr:hypothetical protein [Bryobacteraceae bacterium]